MLKCRYILGEPFYDIICAEEGNFMQNNNIKYYHYRFHDVLLLLSQSKKEVLRIEMAVSSDRARET